MQYLEEKTLQIPMSVFFRKETEVALPSVLDLFDIAKVLDKRETRVVASMTESGKKLYYMACLDGMKRNGLQIYSRSEDAPYFSDQFEECFFEKGYEKVTRFTKVKVLEPWPYPESPAIQGEVLKTVLGNGFLTLGQMWHLLRTSKELFPPGKVVFPVMDKHYRVRRVEPHANYHNGEFLGWYFDMPDIDNCWNIPFTGTHVVVPEKIGL